MSTASNPLIVRDLPPDFTLARGKHGTPGDGMCFREAARWIAGETFCDEVPDCMCPVLATIGMRFNDSYSDEERQLLVPLLIRCIGTRAPLEVMRRRSYVMIDAAVREITPMAMDAVKWADLADRLRELAPIVDAASARAANAVAVAVRDESRRRRDAAADAATAAAAATAATYYDGTAADAAATAATAAAAAAAATYYDGTAADADATAATAAAAAAAAAADADAAAATYYDGTAADADVAAAAAAYYDDEARRPIVLATIAAFSRVIDVVAEPAP